MTQVLALLVVASLTQFACYNTYTIDKSQLEKLESQVEQKEVVKVDSEGAEPIPVSTANPVTVVTNGGDEYRVTPFNFMMSETQLVSPEYDLLLSLKQVEGARVRQFSTWKTTATIVGVSAVAIGTFVGISILAPDSEGFQN